MLSGGGTRRGGRALQALADRSQPAVPPAGQNTTPHTSQLTHRKGHHVLRSGPRGHCRGQTWNFPSRGETRGKHHKRANYLVALMVVNVVGGK